MSDKATKANTNMMNQELFDDDQVANTLESLAGTLKAAKKKSVVSYGPELLLQVKEHCIHISTRLWITYIYRQTTRHTDGQKFD